MTYRSEPITMWIDRRLVMKKSVIQGIGTFAIEAIPAGQLLILTTGGLVLTLEDKQSGELQLEAEMYNEESLPGNLSIVTPKVFHYYVNHCCEPNAVDVSRGPNVTQYIAWQDIKAQEEITTDYGVIGARIERCMCGLLRCRGHITPEDWRLPNCSNGTVDTFLGSLSRRYGKQTRQEASPRTSSRPPPNTALQSDERNGVILTPGTFTNVPSLSQPCSFPSAVKRYSLNHTKPYFTCQ